MRSLRPVLVAVAVLGVLLLALVGASTTAPWELAGGQAPQLPQPPPEMTESPIPQAPGEGRPDVTDAPGGVGQVVLVLLGALVLGVLLRLLGRLRRDRPTSAPQPPTTPGGAALAGAHTAEAEPDLPVLRRGVQEAHHALARHPDPHDAVIAAWLAVEEAAADADAPRRPAQTPTELATEVLGATRADPTAVRTLLSLYHRARFATGPSGAMGPEEVATADACLRALAQSWEVRR